MKTNIVKELFNFYLNNQENLVEKYDGKYIVITANGVEGAYDKEPEGYYAAMKKYGLGNFIIQLCTPGEEAYTRQYVVFFPNPVNP